MHTHASGAADGRSPHSLFALQRFGWGEGYPPTPVPTGLEPARVLAHCRGKSLVQSAHGEGWSNPTGRFRDTLESQGLQPCAGDWLLVEPIGERFLGHALLPRRTFLARQSAGPSGRAQALAANLDVVFLAMGLDRDYNPARLERFLALAWGSGAKPVVLLTKTDLVEDPEPFVERIQGIASDCPILPICVPEGRGLDAVTSHLGEGRTAVLLGSSGVGKSTLLNTLMGGDVRRTQEVRASDGRGRHTTSLRELFLLPCGGCLIDTPGLREVGLLAEASDLESTFADVESFASHCRFRDCTHGAEPECAVRQALGEGLLDPSRFQAFLRLRREVSYAAARADERLWRAREQRWKGIAKLQRKLGRD